jgi:hypothetical protein
LTEEEDKAKNSNRISTFLGPRRESNKKMLLERCNLSPNLEAKQDNQGKSSGGACKEKRDTTKLCCQP